jgi:hypothetical protein
LRQASSEGRSAALVVRFCFFVARFGDARFLLAGRFFFDWAIRFAAFPLGTPSVVQVRRRAARQ